MFPVYLFLKSGKGTNRIKNMKKRNGTDNKMETKKYHTA
jgi:hypothetical protein